MAEHKNIYAALAAAQGEFGKVTKGATNPAFKSKYADLADVASVVIPVMNAHGCAVLHYMAWTCDTQCMRTEFHHADSGTSVFCDIPLVVDRNNMQGMKSATTYAKRIGLESLSGIAPEDDDGNAAASAPPKREAKPATITDEQRIELMQLLDHLGIAAADFLTVAKLKDLRQLPAEKFEGAKKWINEQAKAKRETIAGAIDDEVQY